MSAPEGKTHWPVVTADYQNTDAKVGYGDACYLDIGQSTWDKGEFSAKIWRWADNGGRWSRQSEELPLTRLLDLATLAIAVITGKQSNLMEYPQRGEQVAALTSYMNENMQSLAPRLAELKRLLSNQEKSENDRSVPSIFSFATSELSQDAVFAWLLAWADSRCEDKDFALHQVAVSFIQLLMGDDRPVKTIVVGRQWEHIDVWVEIDNDAFLVIEDKTGTSIHDDQLERYRDVAMTEYPGRKIYFAYVKTGNEPRSVIEKVEKAGYRSVMRRDILDCLEAYVGNNAILCDYRASLRRKEEETQGFKKLPMGEWSWSCWEGFYKELENRNVIHDWAYVANPAGGFLGAYWHFMGLPHGSGEMYLQFEQEWLCFKICPECGSSERSAVRNKWHNDLIRLAADKFPEIRRPDRFGAGTYMTIAKVDCIKLWGDGCIDMDAVVEKIRSYEALVDECVKQQ